MLMDRYGNTSTTARMRMNNRYRQMSRSNTEFLNLFGRESKEIKALKEDYFARIDALPATDKAGKDALFAEFESKLVALKASQAELDEVKKAKRKAERGEKISSKLTTALDYFTKTTQALGIGKDVGQKDSSSNGGEGGGRDDGGGGGDSGGGGKLKEIPTWVWIVGGVAVLGLGFLAYKKFGK